MEILGFFQNEIKKTTVTVTMVNTKYFIVVGDQNLHVLNHKSLIFNLKRLDIKPKYIVEVLEWLDNVGMVEFELEDVAS